MHTVNQVKGNFKMESISRRNFLKASAIAAGGTIGTGMINLPILSGKQAFAQTETTEFLESNCGTEGRKLLVVYDSYCGSTSGVAKHIADTLCRKGARVDLLKVDHVSDISIYDGAVIGSAVKSSSWRSSAIDFAAAHKSTLARIPVAYFLTCIALYHDTPKARQTAQSYFDPVLKKVPEITPVTARAFAGVLDYSKMNMMVKMIMKSKMKDKGIPEGDYRNFEQIGKWTLEKVWPAMIA